MATKPTSDPQRPHATPLQADQLRVAIALLNNRIDELRFSRPQNAIEIGVAVTQIKTKVDQTFAEIFGADKFEAHEAQVNRATFFTFPAESVTERIQAFQGGCALLHGRLKAQIDIFKERLERLDSEQALKPDRERTMSPRHGVQRICLNGHQRAVDILGEPEEIFCPQCGQLNIVSCQHCQEPIRGVPLDDDIIGLSALPVPNFCHKCGKSFPWMERRLEAAVQILQTEEADAAAEAELRGALVAISSDTPQTGLGVVRIKKIMAKVGKPVGDALYKIVIDLATEAAKKGLLGS